MGRPPLRRTLDVRINGRLAGFYRYSPAGGVTFDYDASWLDWEFAFPISRQLPLQADVQASARVSAVFENLLPDNGRIRALIAERTAARSERPHDLLAVIGRDCVGAMQFLPQGEDPGDPFRIEGEPQSEAEIADTIRNLTVAPLGIREGEPLRISLAGAQEKTAYLRRDGMWLRPVGLTPTTHIFKRPLGVLHDDLDMRDSVENEFLCLRIAAELGLPVASAAIERFEDQTVLVVERFDRRDRPSGGILRLPQEDFLQALGLESAQKYQQHGGPGMADCFRLLEGSMSRAADVGLFLKAQLVFWMIAAIDGHAKNFSIFNEPRGFRMTPLYDVLSAAPPHLRDGFRHKELQLAMSAGTGRHYRLDQLHPRHFDDTADRARVPLETRRRAFADLAEAGVAALERAGNDLPPGFPDRIVTPILDYGRHRMNVLVDFVDSVPAAR